MNKILHEILSLYNYNYEIIEKNTSGLEAAFSEVIVIPRWEVQTYEYAKKEDIQFTSTYLKIISTKMLLYIPLLKNRKIKTDFLSSILNVRANSLRKIDKSFTTPKNNEFLNNYLILKRSSQPRYYDKGGGAEIPTYGTARREVIGIEKTVQDLRENNISIKIYEPGKHTLIEQINIFRNCKGIVGIRGAEFANLIWMKPKRKVILIHPIDMLRHPAERVLSKYLGHNYFEITTKEGNFPTLDTNLILKYLTQ